MGVCEGSKCFEIVALDKNMIWRIRTRLGQCSVFILYEYRKLVAQTVFHIFGLILPYKSVGFGFTEKSEKCRAFIVRQPLKSVDAVY